MNLPRSTLQNGSIHEDIYDSTSILYTYTECLKEKTLVQIIAPEVP